MTRMLLTVALLSTSAHAQVAEPSWRAMPGGTFTFGCSDEKVATTKKSTKTQVRAFWMMPERVSVAQYEACVSARQCRPRATATQCTSTPSAPATCVGYMQAHRYCRWVGGRLPTEVEWEYAADTGVDMNAGPGVDAANGAIEWVIGPREFTSQQDNTRGGVADLTPLARCVGGYADGDLETGSMGFRCVRTSPPGVFPRRFRDAQRKLRHFEVRGKHLAFSERLEGDELARTFVGCKTGLRPLGPWRATKNEIFLLGAEKHDVVWQLHDAPCTDALFVITADDARAGGFTPLGKGPKFGDTTFKPAAPVGSKFSPCVLVHGSQSTAVPGDWTSCEVKLAADLNGDELPDFVIHAYDVCTVAVLMLSDGGGAWHVAARDEVWCPD